MEAVALNVAQQRVLDELGSIDRPSFEPSLQAELRAELQDAFSPMATVVTEEDHPSSPSEPSDWCSLASNTT